MKILYYCQHVLGVGHFFRSLEIVKALSGHEVILVTGGAPVETPLPAHVREIRLPGLMMDSDFKEIFSVDPEKSVEAVKAERRDIFREIVRAEAPALMLVELYPFGRKAFRFELDPVLDAIRNGDLPPCRVVCSLRDILVEKNDPAAYEKRVLKILNRWFDALLIHADPSLLRLDETFSRTADIQIPTVYTGFVTPKPFSDARLRLRNELGLSADERLVVASVGSGSVGGELLRAVANAFAFMDQKFRIQVFTGPFMDADTVSYLQHFSGECFRTEPFTPDFLSWLAAADLSVSMAGYNTCMNLMAAGVPALVWPFGQNREQRFRAGRLAAFGGLQILENDHLVPSRLAALMQDRASGVRFSAKMDLSGAENTARWINEWLAVKESNDEI